MFQIVTQEDRADVDKMEAFVLHHPDGHFLQSTLWPHVKKQWAWRGVLSVEENSGAVKGALSILVRRMPLKLSLLYAPRGPVCARDDEQTLAELFAGAREVAKRFHGYAMYIDPDVLEDDEAFCRLMGGFGFFLKERSLNFEGIQPRFVFRLPIAGKTEEEVMAGFESKTRYNIRLAGRRGVTVSHWTGDGPVPDSSLDAFSSLMEETGKRDHFMVRSRGYFADMFKSLGKHARLYMAYQNGVPIAGAVAVQYGNKTWYSYGASSNEHREAMPNYLLQWEMIRWAIEGRCSLYDFRGISGDLSPSNPLYGLYRFKKGFNGDFTAFAGQFTIFYKPAAARLMLFSQKEFMKLRRLWTNFRRR